MNFTTRQIAEKLQISKSSVSRIFNEKDLSLSPEKLGRKSRISTENETKLLGVVRRNPHLGLRRISKKVKFECSHTTVLKVLKKHKFVKKTVKKKIFLKKVTKNKRSHYCKKLLLEKVSLENWIFVDEKKFKFNGPDGYNQIWQEKKSKKKPCFYSTDYHDFRGVMVFMAISKNGILYIERIRGSITGEFYSKLICERLLPIIQARHGENFTIVQDNARGHVSKLAKKCFMEKNIRFSDHPPNSPDLNPIENVWSLLSRAVYEEKRTFNNDDELWEQIMLKKEEIPIENIANCIDKLTEQSLEVYKLNGGSL